MECQAHKMKMDTYQGRKHEKETLSSVRIYGTLPYTTAVFFSFLRLYLNVSWCVYVCFYSYVC